MTRHSRPIYFSELAMQSRQIWRGCHTSVDSGDLSQAPPKQSAVCSTYIIPAPPANCQFNFLDGQRLRHECHPTYLRVTLDRTLSYREHMTKTAGKLKNRNNLLMKLAGSAWGASANTVRSSALALCYSTAESLVDVSALMTPRHYKCRRLVGLPLATAPFRWLQRVYGTVCL